MRFRNRKQIEPNILDVISSEVIYREMCKEVINDIPIEYLTTLFKGSMIQAFEPESDGGPRYLTEFEVEININLEVK